VTAFMLHAQVWVDAAKALREEARAQDTALQAAKAAAEAADAHLVTARHALIVAAGLARKAQQTLADPPPQVNSCCCLLPSEPGNGTLEHVLCACSHRATRCRGLCHTATEQHDSITAL